MPRTLPLRLLIALTAGAAACSPASDSSPSNTPARAANSTPDTPLIVAIEVALEDLTFDATMPGTIHPIEFAELFANVGGYLLSVAVDIGDEVEKGAVLAVIDVPEMIPQVRAQEAEIEYARSQVEQMTAAIEHARAAVVAAEADALALKSTRRAKEADVALRHSELDRWKELLEVSPSIEKRKVDEAAHKLAVAEAALARVDADTISAHAHIGQARAAVSKAEADERAARAHVPVAEAQLDAIRTLMEYAEIKAPFAGVITERNVHPGAFVRAASTNSAAMSLLRIERIDRVFVAVDLPMDCVAELDRGDRVRLDHLAAAPEAVFEGTITRVASALDVRSRMMRAEIEFDNPADAAGDRTLYPGYYGNLTVFLTEYPGTPTVPASAVFMHEGESCVYTVVGDKTHRQPIEVVYRDGTRVGVSKGLSAGDTVVASGMSELADGQRVRTKIISFGGSR